MTRCRRLGAVVVAVGLLLSSTACNDDDDGGRGDAARPATDAGDPDETIPDDGDAVLIPPTGETSPTSGPPNTDPLAAAAAPGPGTCVGRSASPASAADDLELRVVLGETLEAGRVRWTLEVQNQGDAAVTLVYPTSQDGDVVLRRGDDEVYRWSADQMFAQQVRCQVIGASQTYRVELARSPLDVEAGDHELVAELSATPAPAPARVDVTIEDPDGG